MNKIQFSILSYYPNFLNNENITIGIAFQNNNNDTEFRITRNWNRVKVFDDEIDLLFMKEYLTGIKNDLEIGLFNQNKNFSLKEYTKYYVNKFRFTKIINTEVANVDKFIKETEKFYLRYDFEKNERLCKFDEIKYIKNLMKSKKIEYSTKGVSGNFNEKIKFDYVINNYGFKNFTFENKNINRQIMTAKAWSYTASKIKDYNIVFTYDAERQNSEEYNIVMDILKENAFKILQKEEVLTFIEEINKNKVYNNELF